MDLRELYQDEILKHSRHPKNSRAMPDATSQAEGYNALCGDRVHVYVKLADDLIADVSFEGSGCAICVASASFMTEKVRGLSKSATAQVASKFVHLAKGESSDEAVKHELGKLVAFEGVSRFPMRVKCATLAWRALERALGIEATTD